jgi:hypothetical protein
LAVVTEGRFIWWVRDGVVDDLFDLLIELDEPIDSKEPNASKQRAQAR